MEPCETKSFCKVKGTVNRAKWQPTELEKIFANPSSDRELITKMYKELTQELRNHYTKLTNFKIGGIKKTEDSQQRHP